MSLGNPAPLCFVDLETGGLDPLWCCILEVGAIKVDQDLKVIDTFHRFVGLPEHKKSTLSPWALEHHEQSGLLAACLATSMTKYEVDVEFSKWLDLGTEMCGHSIHFDRQIIDFQMPESFKRFHYRIRDYGQFGRILRSMDVAVPATPEMPHRSLEDCKIELEEARHIHNLIRRLSRQPYPGHTP